MSAVYLLYTDTVIPILDGSFFDDPMSLLWAQSMGRVTDMGELREVAEQVSQDAES